MNLLFGILSIVIAFFGGALFGVIGGGIGIVLAILAIVFARKIKKDPDREGGTAGFVTGIIGLILAIIMTACFAIAPAAVKEEAQKKGLTNLEKCADGLTYGIFGLLNEAEKQGVDQDTLTDEFNELNK